MKKEHVLYLTFGAILVLLIVTFVYDEGALWGPCRGLAYREGGPHHGMHHAGRGFFGVGFYGFGFLFWILVAFFAVLVFFGNRKENAVDIIKKRYARGEITTEEYNRMKEEIFSHR